MVVNQGHNLPSISTGSLLIVSEVDPVMVAVGDTVTFRMADGPLLIDQVAAVADDAGSGFRMMGYHRGATGPLSVPEAAIAGRVELAVPAVGTAMTMLASTGGAVTALGIIGRVDALDLAHGGCHHDATKVPGEARHGGGACPLSLLPRRPARRGLTRPIH